MKSPPTDQTRQTKALRKAEANRRYYEKKRLERVLYDGAHHEEQKSSEKKRSKTMEVGVTTAYKSIDSLKRTRHAEIIESLTRSYEQITKATLPNETANNRKLVGQVRYSPFSLSS